MQYPLTVKIAKEYGYQPYGRLDWLKRYCAYNDYGDLINQDFKTDILGIGERIVQKSFGNDGKENVILNPKYIYQIRGRTQSSESPTIQYYIPVTGIGLQCQNNPVVGFYCKAKPRWRSPPPEYNIIASYSSKGLDLNMYSIVGYYKPTGMMPFMNWTENPLEVN